jgi:transposase
MTEEEARHLRKENAELKEELAWKGQRIEELEGLLTSALLRIDELERRLAKDSHNSSKPPSSDGFKHKRKKREASSKAKGGQAGHVGHTLEMVETPDQVMIHRPNHCEACQCELGDPEIHRRHRDGAYCPLTNAPRRGKIIRLPERPLSKQKQMD